MSKKLSKILLDLKNLAYKDIVYEATFTVFGVMSIRIFNKGINSDGQTLSEYSKGYKKKRENKGLRVDRKDLQFKSQGSLLISNFNIAKDGKDVIIGMTDDFAYKVAEYQEIQQEKKGKADIFDLTDFESDYLEQQISDLLDDELREI
jgi:hypothetical protein